MRIYDISQPLRPGMPVWPGDQPFEPRWSTRIASGSSVNVGAVTMSLHTGTHADAPLHVRDGARAIHDLPLAAFVGPAIVVEWLTTGPIPPEAVRGITLDETPRVLFRTRQGPPPAEWADEFAHLSEELIDLLIESSIQLIGIDTPSVDPADSKDLRAHHKLYGSGIYNIENLNLYGVREGSYLFVAPPLVVEGFDAAPVRALLIENLNT